MQMQKRDLDLQLRLCYQNNYLCSLSNIAVIHTLIASNVYNKIDDYKSICNNNRLLTNTLLLN